jgi:transposase-like protein
VEKQDNGQYSLEFRLAAVEQLKICSDVGALAKQLGVHRVTLYRWKKDPVHPDQRTHKAAAEKQPGKRILQEQVQHLKQLLAEKTLEVDFFKGALQKVDARRQRSRNSGERTFTNTSEK